jgi:hypothetical protein
LQEVSQSRSGGGIFKKEEGEKEKAVLATNGKLLRPFPIKY